MMLMLLARGSWMTLTTGPARSRLSVDAGVSALLLFFTCKDTWVGAGWVQFTLTVKQ